MRKTLGVVSLLTSLFMFTGAYSSCKKDTDCHPGYKCCYDFSKARHECLLGCGCNAKNAPPCPTGYLCCYDAGKAHHMCMKVECCGNKGCPPNSVCCMHSCYNNNDPSNPCNPGGP